MTRLWTPQDGCLSNPLTLGPWLGLIVHPTKEVPRLHTFSVSVLRRLRGQCGGREAEERKESPSIKDRKVCVPFYIFVSPNYICTRNKCQTWRGRVEGHRGSFCDQEADIGDQGWGGGQRYHILGGQETSEGAWLQCQSVIEIHREMLTIIRLINASFTSHGYLVCICTVKTLNIYSCGKFQVYNTVLFTVITMPYIRTPELTYFITFFLCHQHLPISPTPPVQATTITMLFFASMSLTILNFIICVI